MVKDFQFARIPFIYFGNGKLSDLPGIIKKYGDAFLLVTGNKSFMNSGYAMDLMSGLQKDHLSFHHMVIPGEPSPEMIDRATEKYKNEKVKLVVGIGGGSVMDAGKAISAMLYMGEPVRDYLEGVGTKNHPGTKIPFIAVPTTSGTGSEATRNAVISSIGEDGYKKSLRHDHFVPDIAVIDPRLSLDCPAHLTAASGMDCFTQLVEAYLSDKSSLMTDALVYEGLKAIKSSLKPAVQDGHDMDARTGMSFAALTSGIGLANAGLGVVHGFASSVGGMFHIPHGVVCGALMAPANEINVRELRKKDRNHQALRKYAILGKLFIDHEGKSGDYYTDAFVQYLHRLSEDLKIPGFGSYGMANKDAEHICKITEMKNNPVKLSFEDLLDIIKSRL